MRRHLVALLLALVVVGAGAGMAVAHDPPRLSAHGPTDVSGTEATAVFRIGDRTIRQVRYDDRGTLTYRFVLRNDGSLPVRVDGVEGPARQPRLFRYLGLTGGRFTLKPGASRQVGVRLRMVGCETLSARAGSFASSVALRVTRARVLHDVVRVRFPEQVHTGSPREAFCPRATATSRPPG